MASSGSKGGYIVGPLYDGLFFIFSPLLALFIGYGVALFPITRLPWAHTGRAMQISDVLLGTVVSAHLILVFCRSHGNAKIFKTYPLRFTVVPLALFLGCWQSKHILITTAVVAIWWDVYHSSLQTFGLGRIYDMRAGNDAQAGRRLDYLLNLLFYAGPILGGVTLLDHARSFEQFANPEVKWMFFANIPAWLAPHSSQMTLAVLAIGIPFCLYYLWSYRKLQRQGYKVSWQKVTLYLCTAVVTVVSWGFNSFGQAFLIVNFFHALQYFAIVWWSEQANLRERFGVAKFRLGKELTFALVFGSVLAYGYFVTMFKKDFEYDNSFIFSIALVVSIMHFWYDGFIWSVRKKQVH